MRRRHERGQDGVPLAATQRGSREAAARPPPPTPRTGPQAVGVPAPIPRGRGDSPPSPGPREEPERGPPPRPSRRLPQELGRTSEPARTRQDAAQIAPSEGGRARTGVVWGATPPMDRMTLVTPALLPAQGRQRDGTRQSDPPPYRPLLAAQTGGTAHAPPPPRLPPAHERHGPAPRHAAPTGRADQGDRVGPPHPHARAHSTWIADPNSTPSGRAVGGGGAPDPRRPSQRWKAAPPGTLFRHLHNPKPSRGKPGPDRPPPQARQTEQGTGAGHAEGHGPRGTALPAPSAGTARGAHATPPRGGGSGHRESASAHTRKGHAGTTRRATGPSTRNAQTAWNGVPASEGKGHPDGTARHTQRGTPGAGRGKRERHNTRYRPKPPEPAASAAHTRTGHCTCQGSSGAQRHVPTPRLGSLRASPRGSNWRQTSSTGQAAPAPRATTHQGGDAVGKRPQPRTRIDALIGDWRNGEAGEGRGSEPCEPGGLRHQAGGASWRAPH